MSGSGRIVMSEEEREEEERLDLVLDRLAAAGWLGVALFELAVLAGFAVWMGGRAHGLHDGFVRPAVDTFVVEVLTVGAFAVMGVTVAAAVGWRLVRRGFTWLRVGDLVLAGGLAVLGVWTLARLRYPAYGAPSSSDEALVCLAATICAALSVIPAVRSAWHYSRKLRALVAAP